MPRGITDQDVWKACDALLLEGARPTIERVRQHLGSGSPNTVSPHLDTWFRNLGGRLKDPGAFAAPPDVPDPVLQAARHFWAAAQAEARHDVDVRLKESLAAAVANVEAEKERAHVAEAATFEAAARAARLQAELGRRAAALEEEQLARARAEAQRDDARQQNEDLQARLERSAAALAAAREDTAVAQARTAAAERLAQSIRAERTTGMRRLRPARGG